MDLREAVEGFVEEHPDAEDALRTLLQVDEADSWTFDDVPLDSGRFGDLVSRGIAEKKSNGQYRLTDREAIRRVLDNESIGDADTDSLDLSLGGTRFHEDDRRFVLGLILVLGLVVFFRALAYPAVFRDEFVLLSGNDPYYYRYWVDQLLAASTNPLDTDILSNPPLAKGEPLLVVTLWWFTVLLGGDAATGGLILAWYPVVGAVISSGIVYLLGTTLFDDRRAGIASVAMFALIPVHGFRASLGFADHHAFDYPWLALTLLGLVFITKPRDQPPIRSKTAWLGTVVLTLGVAGQTLAWDASPIILGTIGLFLAVRVISDISHGSSPILRNTPILIGLLGAVTITHLVHTHLGWHTGQVAYAPGLVLLGGLAVVLTGETLYRLGGPAWGVILLEILGGIVGWQVFNRVLPTYADVLRSRVVGLFDDRGIAEMTGLLDREFGSIIGPVFLFGFILFLVLPYLAWITYKSITMDRSDWLAASVYAWYFLFLATIQIRFAGELSPIIATFAGFGLVHLAARIDVTSDPHLLRSEPMRVDGGEQKLNRTRLVSLMFLVLLVGSLSFVQIPIKTNQLTVEEGEYQAVRWIKTDSDQHALAYPENRVFSDWGRVRMYNYFVNGESRSYAFAQSNYDDFAASNDPPAWYVRLHDRIGYIVIQDSNRFASLPAESIHQRFLTNHASGDERTTGFANYRVVYIDPKHWVLVVRLVPGATLTGVTSPNETIQATTTIKTDGIEFDYIRHGTADMNGNYSVTVAYPGEYTVAGQQITVTEDAIRNGSTLHIPTA